METNYPGPRSAAMLRELSRYVIADPQPFAVDLERSQGMWTATVDGRRIFDWAGLYGAKLLGHNHPGMQDAAYLRRLLLAANNKLANPDFLTEDCLAYYREVHGLAPAAMRSEGLEVYAVNSGAEAVENMMKYLINLHRAKAQRLGHPPGRGRFVYFDQAFHGRTVFALNVTELPHDPVITRGFHDYIEGNIQLPFPAVDTDAGAPANLARCRQALAGLEAVLQAHGPSIAAILVEPLQGAGGQRVALPEFHRGLSDLAHRYDVFVGYDEVQTAGGQTGSFFAIDQFDLPYPPQAVAAAKKLGCGVVFMLRSMDDRGVLDSTWGGTLADMVRFVQEIGIVRREQLIEQVPVKAERLAAHLKALACSHPALMCNVRGMGLYQGFSLRSPAIKRLLQHAALQEQDLLLLGAATDSIRLRPPIDVTLAEIDLLAEKLQAALASVAFAVKAVPAATDGLPDSSA